MCKMLFIGTKNELQEIPFDTANPDFYLEKISGEFLPVKQTFKNQNIYFVGTSRGCSCDFGIQSNKCDPRLIEHISPMQNIMNKFRKLSGTFDEWENGHREKVANAIKAQATFLTQTLKLVDIILEETIKGNVVETYCVWAGDYNSTPEFNGIIDTTNINLKDKFEISEKEFSTIM